MASNKKRASSTANNDKPKKPRLAGFFDTDCLTEHQAGAYAKQLEDNHPLVYQQRQYDRFKTHWESYLSKLWAIEQKDDGMFAPQKKPYETTTNAHISIIVQWPQHPFSGEYLQQSVYTHLMQPYAEILDVCGHFFHVPTVTHAEKHVLMDAVLQRHDAKTVWNALIVLYGGDHVPCYTSVMTPFQSMALKRIGRATKAANFATNLQAFLKAYTVGDANPRCAAWLQGLDNHIEAIRARWGEYYQDDGTPIPNPSYETPVSLLERLIRNYIPAYDTPYDGDASLHFDHEWVKLSPVQ